MVNTLKKIVIGALFAATVTLFVGTTDTFAADKWATVRQNIINDYKASLEKAVAQEKAFRQGIIDEAQYVTTLQDLYKKGVITAELYVKAVSEESRGLDVKAIKEAQSFSQSLIDQANWRYNAYRSNFKTQAEEDAFNEWPEWNEDMTEEEQEEYNKAVDEKIKAFDEFWKGAPEVNWGEWDSDSESFKANYDEKAYERAYKAVHPDAD